MKKDEKEKDSRPHFVDANYPKDELWKTNIYFGPRDGTGLHAHLVLSGAAILYLRDIPGDVIIKNGEEKNNKE
ncbi:hypothetical protein A2647_05070 [Candidatus Nomurabacteria bacterium RIFCSPHIGHO2_01_FULL_40_24b]|uniref:Uncharacterized protein n=1 Tax=Candidatus Nomurabacteria bacterium RIFCSPHIGHO2_01_FULL_40_24b TaxID=1801739 RepID=A0A1F6V7Q7_9BACT|nr:MAG: hypothetical protein A2647_05070 [Candidatus Nomurabacteria bacterium RIFCSPHIGHO2_01_FULL_40_24b]